MNFFGHCTVACWHSRQPAFVLGAMLPDLASMCRGRVVGTADQLVAAGMDFHHRTDAVFHDLPAFQRLYLDATRALRQSGVARGTARGAAHVAVELLIDGELAGDADAVHAYTSALACAAHLPADAIAWQTPEQSARWLALIERMRHYGAPAGYSDPDVVANRVIAILARYPRLAPSAEEEMLLGAAMHTVKERVQAETPALMAAMRTGLASPGR